MAPMETASSKLKAWRADKKLTQAQLADMLAVRQATISRLENGEQELSLSLGRRLVELGAITADDLIASAKAA